MYRSAVFLIFLAACSLERAEGVRITTPIAQAVDGQCEAQPNHRGERSCEGYVRLASERVYRVLAINSDGSVEVWERNGFGLHRTTLPPETPTLDAVSLADDRIEQFRYDFEEEDD